MWQVTELYVRNRNVKINKQEINKNFAEIQYTFIISNYFHKFYEFDILYYLFGNFYIFLQAEKNNSIKHYVEIFKLTITKLCRQNMDNSNKT